MIEINPQFLIERDDPNYPPHHTGMHLEETFIKFWEANQTLNRKLIFKDKLIKKKIEKRGIKSLKLIMNIIRL